MITFVAVLSYLVHLIGFKLLYYKIRHFLLKDCSIQVNDSEGCQVAKFSQKFLPQTMHGPVIVHRIYKPALKKKSSFCIQHSIFICLYNSHIHTFSHDQKLDFL
jgi:hypothetical protein